MTNYAKIVGNRDVRKTVTPQNEPIPGREQEMVENHAGGYSFKLEDSKRLQRFLILGVEGNTYYQGQRKLTLENVKCVSDCLDQDAMGVIDLVVDISTNGRALKQEPGLYVLAMAASYGMDIPEAKKPFQADDTQAWAEYDDIKKAYDHASSVRSYALSNLSRVARTGTSLYQFAEYVKTMRGWGRALRKAFARWYVEKPLNKLALQAWKYKQRGGWSHRDAMRLAHPVTDDVLRNEIFKYLTHPDKSPLVNRSLVEGEGGIYTSTGKVRVGENTAPLAQIQAAETLLHIEGSTKADVKKAVKLIIDHRLTHEAVPSQLKKTREVWQALLPDMPMQALVSNLGRLTSVGVIDNFSTGTNLVVELLGNREVIKNSRIHPMRFLIARKQYQTGNGRSGMSWTPNAQVTDALDKAFYLAFGNVVPTGKNILVAVDDSGSMNGSWSGTVMGIPGFLPSEAACAMALVTYVTEPNAHMITFDDRPHEVEGLSKNATIGDVQRYIGHGGATNTAAPLDYLLKKGYDVEAIVSYTDNETWNGRWGNPGHVTEKLRNYNRAVGHSVKFLNCAVTATDSTDVDPKNVEMFELVGMDASTPRIISEYIDGNL